MFIINHAKYNYENDVLDNSVFYKCETKEEAHKKLEEIHTEILEEYRATYSWDPYEDISFEPGCDTFSMLNKDLVLSTVTIYEVSSNKNINC